MKKPRILGLIVARKNSKGLKNKHLINIKKKHVLNGLLKQLISQKC